MIVERTMRIIGSSSELAFQGVEAALKNTASDGGYELSLSFRRAVEFRRPFDKGPLAVGDRRQSKRCHVVLDTHWRFEDRICAEQVKVRKAQKFFSDSIAVAQAEIAHATDLVRRFAVLDPALGDSGMPGGQAVEIAHACPDAVGAAVDDARNVDAGHGSPSLFLGSRPAVKRLVAAAFFGALLGLCFCAGALTDPLHVARLANEAGHSRKAPALDTDLGEDLIDHRRLHAVAQRRIDDFVGRAAPAAATTAIEAVNLQYADALDLLHRFDALAHDALDTLKQPPAEERGAGCVGEDVLGFVEQPLGICFDDGAHLLGGRRDPHFVGFLFGNQHLDRPAASRHLAFAYRLDPLLGLDRLSPGRFRVGLRGRLVERLAVDFDRAFHAGGLDRRLAGDFQLTEFPVAQDTGLVDPTLRGDACPFARLARGYLGLLQRLSAGDLELLQGAPAFEPGEFERLLAQNVGAPYMLRGDDIGFLHATIGVRSLRELGGDFDRTILLGDLDDLPAFDIEDVAGPRRDDPLALQGKLDRDARGLDGLAPPDLGVLDGLLARYVARFRLLLGGDALRGEAFLLGDAVHLDRFARHDLGRIHGAVAGDLQRSHLFVARYPLGGDFPVLQNANRLDKRARRDVGVL